MRPFRLAVAAVFTTCVHLAAARAEADPFNGRLLFQACRTCHDLKPGGKNKQGPNLAGLFGRTAGGVPGFEYSDAMRRSGVVWSEATLDAFLAKPKAYVPGTTMVYGGLRRARDRRDLIAYLKQALAAAGR